MNIEIKEAYFDLENIKILFEEYTSSLGIDLTFQNYAEELSNLPGKYAKPGGRLYIAYFGGFAEIPPYYKSLVEDTHFLCLTL